MDLKEKKLRKMICKMNLNKKKKIRSLNRRKKKMEKVVKNLNRLPNKKNNRQFLLKDKLINQN